MLDPETLETSVETVGAGAGAVWFLRQRSPHAKTSTGA